MPFYKSFENEVVYLLVWVDDIIIASSCQQLMDKTKSHLSQKFKMKDLGELKHFIGIHSYRTNHEISLSQEEYIVKVLKKFGMNNCKSRGSPCEVNPNAYDNDCSKPYDQHLYRQMVRSLIYAMVCTRPDLSYVVTKLSQHLSCPTTGDANMLKHVFRYLKKTSGHRLTVSKSTNGLQITAYYDTDWAAPNDRRSISGYC